MKFQKSHKALYPVGRIAMSFDPSCLTGVFPNQSFLSVVIYFLPLLHLIEWKACGMEFTLLYLLCIFPLALASFPHDFEL